MFRFLSQTNTRKKSGMLIAALLVAISPAWAAGPPQPSSLSNPLAIGLVSIAVVLLLAIALLANVLQGIAGIYLKDKPADEAKKTANAANLTALIGLLLFTVPAFAQDAVAEATAPVAANFNGLTGTAFYLMISVIILEVAVIVLMLLQMRSLMRAHKAKYEAPAVNAITGEAVPTQPQISWWDKLNAFRSADQEADIDLGHDYDGIRELDNRLPPWWLYGFYICIVFAGIYMWRYHVSHNGPSSAEEYEAAVAQAEIEKAAYLKKSANNVDETTVKLVTDASTIEAGKTIFATNCVACHGAAGEGNAVGPNLTDDYWLHGGSIADVFKSVKYGWQEKGMRSWKDDLTPLQMSQVSNYIKSLRGTNPPNAKAPQGDLYKEEGATDSAPAADSTATAVVASK